MASLGEAAAPDHDSQMDVGLGRVHLRVRSAAAMAALAGPEEYTEDRLCRPSRADGSDACDQADSGSGSRIVGAGWHVLAGGHEETFPHHRRSNPILNPSSPCRRWVHDGRNKLGEESDGSWRSGGGARRGCGRPYLECGPTMKNRKWLS